MAAPAAGWPTAAPIIAPVPAPSTPPPSVPSSRVDNGWPLHPARAKAAANTNATVANMPLFGYPLYFIDLSSFSHDYSARAITHRLRLLSLLLLLELLDLLTLLLELLLLLLDLALGLRLRVFVVLHRIAYREATHAADCTADSRARAGSAHRGTDNRAGRRTQSATYKRALLTSRQRLPRAAGN